MQIKENISLAELTSFKTGGEAEKLVVVRSTADLYKFLNSSDLKEPIWILGSGTNVLVSDKGLPGTVLALKGGQIQDDGQLITVDAGVWWDDFVVHTLDRHLWGVELMSGIPGTVGAAVTGNIAAYGQSVDQTLKNVEVVDLNNLSAGPKTLSTDELGLDYRFSKLQTPVYKGWLVTKATFSLSQVKTMSLEYASALSVAKELDKDPEKLNDRRSIIMEARRRAGSLVENERHHTAGSFFKNPLVDEKRMEQILEFEEHGVSKEKLKQQQKIHGGSVSRVSAALVLLAAGFERGQRWGPVRLHPDHVLKIENTGGAKSQQIYNVAQEIISTVKEKLDISLEPEVRFLGEFN